VNSENRIELTFELLTDTDDIIDMKDKHKVMTIPHMNLC